MMDVEDLLAAASENLSVRRAFGTAYEKDGMLIIPVALVAGGGGGAPARHGPGAITRPPVPVPGRERARRDTTQHRATRGARTPAGASAVWCCRPAPTW